MSARGLRKAAEQTSAAAAAAPVRYELSETGKAAAVCWSACFGGAPCRFNHPPGCDSFTLHV